MCTCKNDVFDAKICKRALVASTEGYLAVAASTPTLDTLVSVIYLVYFYCDYKFVNVFDCDHKCVKVKV